MTEAGALIPAFSQREKGQIHCAEEELLALRYPKEKALTRRAHGPAMPPE